MKHLLRPFASSLLLVVAVALGGSAHAQGPSVWTSVTPTPFPTGGIIHIVKFLDRFNRPDSGVVGKDTSIWYTWSGGQTPASWKTATITGTNPGASFVTGWVNDISFKDPMNGAAIITGNTDPVDSGLLITHDGGATWTFDDHAGTPDSGSGVYWNPANGYLFVSSLDVGKGLVSSSDGGVTWHKIDSTSTHYTGFAFSDGMHGVVATQGSNQNGFPPKFPWMRTSDGGVTWHKCVMFWESWQPLAVPTTGTYFASTDFFLGSNQPQPMLLRSDDGGNSFGPEITYSGTGDTLTEDVVGDGCDLYAPSFFSVNAIWYSVNDGKLWQTLNGAPAPPIDTRIYASLSSVWSFTGNTLSYAPRPATNSIHIYPSDSIAFTKASCGNTSDTVVHIIGCVCANDDILERTDTGAQTKDTFTSVVTGWPHSLCATTSAPDSNADSVHIHYNPSNVNPDVGNDTIFYMENGTLKDTIIHLWGNGVTPGLTLVDPSFNSSTPRMVLSVPACQDTNDACFDLVNTSCTEVTVLRENLTIADSDKCILQISPPQSDFPVTLPPGASIHVCVSFQGRIQKASTDALVSFDWQAGSTSGTTKSVDIVALTTSSTHPEFRGLNLSVSDCCRVPDDTEIYFVNTTTCPDTLTLNGVDFFHADDPNMFSLDTALMLKKGFRSPIFPIQVPPNAFLPLWVRISDCHGGVFHDSIRFRYSFGSGTGSCAQAVAGTWDTIMTLRVGTTGPVAPTVSTNNLRFVVNCCDTSTVETMNIIPGCKSDTLDTIIFSSPNGDFTASLPTTPLPVNGPIQIRVRYRNPRPSGSTGSLTFKFEGGELSPTTETLITQLTGSCTSSAVAPLTSGTMDFGTLACDSGACDTVWMKGSPCGSEKIGDISVVNTPFSLSSPTTGTVLNPGDSVPVIVCMNPPPSGSNSATIVMQITDAGTGAVGVPDTLLVSGTITPPSPSFTLTQLASATMGACDTMDEQFTLTNTGSCYTYVLQSASSQSGTNVTATPNGTNFPVRVAPGGSQVFTVHFDPKGTAGTLQGNITLVDSGGQTITVPYDITDTPCQTTSTFNFSIQDSVITTPNCIKGTTQFTASSGNGGGTVTSVVLTGSPQFSTPGAAGTSLPYAGTVTFDPNVAGNDTAVLTVNVSIGGKTYKKTVTLIGKTVGTKFTTRIGLSSPTNGCIHPNDTDLERFNVTLGDTLWDSLNVNQLHFLIHYDGDLLWNPKFLNLAPGWSVASEYEDTMGLHITLKYNGSGHGFTAAGDTILTVTQLGAVSKELNTTAYMDSTHFNDSAYEACVMKALSYTGMNQVPVCITVTCPQNIIQDGLTGALKTTPIDKLTIIPNPIRQDGTAATVNFHTTVAGSAIVEVVNELGNPVSELVNGPVIKGDHIVPILTNNMAQGAYFVRITMNGYTLVRKFVLEKE